MAAREIAIGKRLKISQAQEYMVFAVMVASVALGTALALVIHFMNEIAFNAEVIGAKNAAIDAYSDVISEIGVCKKPKGKTYSEEELKKCSPDMIEVSEIPGTLLARILQDLAASQSLNAVPKEDDSSCINPDTGKNYTYDELEAVYDDADGEKLAAASSLLKTCSALRVIPDALPAFKNEEALLSSLNKIFIMSGWEPESLSPSGNSSVTTANGGLGNLSLNLSIEANTETTLTVLNNIERSIRNFDIESATISWGKEGTLELTARANAYYMTPSVLKEVNKTISAKGKK